MASANTYLINIWPEDTLPVTQKQPFSHSNEEAIKEEKQQPRPQRDTRIKIVALCISMAEGSSLQQICM